MGTNKTGLKTLDKVAKDPRIEEVWSEGRDGYWASLKDGYNAEGCGCIHEWTAKALVEALGRIEEGPRY